MKRGFFTVMIMVSGLVVSCTNGGTDGNVELTDTTNVNLVDTMLVDTVLID
jgi:hypothetical protein